jgi:parvulin-like peptidyl-prolyl isomerase
MTATPDYTPTPQPTPTEFTQESFQSVYDNYLTTLAGINFSRQELRELVKAQLLREKMVAEVTKDVETESEQVWARHILVATEEEAATVTQRLAAGEDFAALASELSTDTSNKDIGGDLGWFNREAMVAPFADAAFAMQIGETSDPVQTSFGFHIIQVIGHEVRPLTADQFSQAKDKAFGMWIETKKTELQVETFDRWMNSVPTVPAIPAELLQAIAAGSSGSGTTFP